MKTITVLFITLMSAVSFAAPKKENLLTGAMMCVFTTPEHNDIVLHMHATKGVGQFTLTNDTEGTFHSKNVYVSRGQLCSSYGFSCEEIIAVSPTKQASETSDYFVLHFAEEFDGKMFTLLPDFNSQASVPFRKNGKNIHINSNMSCQGQFELK